MTTSTKTLNQVVSAEKQIKSRIYSEITALDKSLQKPDLLNGFIRKYAAKDETGETFPDETKKVQVSAKESLATVQSLMSELFDMEATKDASNGKARADIVLGDKTIVSNVPATTLLFLEKQLNDLHTLVSRTPVLDTAEAWTFDANTQIFKSETVSTNRTKKNQKALVLYHATTEHPAQATVITEDEIAGTWSLTKHSSALRVDEKSQLLDRINQMSVAVKYAREKANSVAAEELRIGKAVLGFVFQ